MYFCLEDWSEDFTLGKGWCLSKLWNDIYIYKVIVNMVNSISNWYHWTLTSPRFLCPPNPMAKIVNSHTAARLPWNMPTPASIPMLWTVVADGLLGCVCWEMFFAILYPYYHAWTKKNLHDSLLIQICLGITKLKRVFFFRLPPRKKHIPMWGKDRLSSKVPAGRGYVSLSQGHYCLPPSTQT